MTSNKLCTLDLFSGIGGFSLGLERTGAFITTMFCEIDPYCREVLKKNFPGVPIHEDIKTLSIKEGQYDVITGGFPCQDISLAGRGGGLSGERSGLVFEILRLIEEGKPKFVILENSPALRSRGLDIILQALHALGYDAEWHCIPASHLGAHHQRDRIWLIAYPRGQQLQGYRNANKGSPTKELSSADTVAYPDSERPHGAGKWTKQAGRSQSPNSSSEMADTYGARLEELFKGQAAKQSALVGASEWSIEPDVGRVAYGVSGRVHRIKQLGNSVVPVIPEAIGYAIASL